jgi:hypothetical protein
MAENYDEQQALYRYVSEHQPERLTPLERLAERVGVVREKANHCDSDELSNMLWKRCGAEASGPMAEQAFALIGTDFDGLQAFRARVAERLEIEIANGRLVINRCPACSRVVRTPHARQCFWCGHDWHDR